MSPIPINASMGMFISLAVAFIVTPWRAQRFLRTAHSAGEDRLGARLGRLSQRVFAPFVGDMRGRRHRAALWLAVLALILVSLSLPVFMLVLFMMLPFDNKSEFHVVVDMPAGTPVEQTAAALHAMTQYLASVPEVQSYQAYAGLAAPINFNGLVRQYYLRAGGELGDIQVNLVDKHARSEQSHAIATRMRPQLAEIGARYRARVKVVEVPPGPPVLSPIIAEVYGPDEAGRHQVAAALREVFLKTRGVVDDDTSTLDAAPQQDLVVDRRKAGLLGIPQARIVDTLRTGLSGDELTYLLVGAKYPIPARIALPLRAQGDLQALLSLSVRGAQGQLVSLRELVSVVDSQREQPVFHKDLLPMAFVTGDMAGAIDSPLYGMFAMRGELAKLTVPGGGMRTDYFIRQPADPYRGYAVKWDGEWQITYETFRDMGAAYAVGLVLIYLLLVAQFGSYLTPLVIMAPIPLTVIGVMPGHALLGAPFTATSMIGMIALAGIIVRNSILLVDFINLQLAAGVGFKQAVICSAAVRARPIALTALAAMLGALFILDDPIFNGLAISLIFGILVSTVLTLVVIPLFYYRLYRRRFTSLSTPTQTGEARHEILATRSRRRRQLHSIVARAGCARQPAVRQRQLVMVHGLCRRLSFTERA